MVGNHDSRTQFLDALPLPGDVLPGYVQFRWDCGETTILCLDTLQPGEVSGEMDAPRLNWLEAQLSQTGDRRVLVFMHHPPGALGLGPLDGIALQNPDPLLDILAAAPQVAHVFCGHVHRPVSGTIRGVPFTTLRTTSTQIRPPTQDWQWGTSTAHDERPQYGVILIAPDRLVVHGLDIEDPA